MTARTTARNSQYSREAAQVSQVAHVECEHPLIEVAEQVERLDAD
jgi:hypothetical protein